MKTYAGASLTGFTNPSDIHTYPHPDGVAVTFFHGPEGLGGNFGVTMSTVCARFLATKLVNAATEAEAKAAKAEAAS